MSGFEHDRQSFTRPTALTIVMPQSNPPNNRNEKRTKIHSIPELLCGSWSSALLIGVLWKVRRRTGWPPRPPMPMPRPPLRTGTS